MIKKLFFLVICFVLTVSVNAQVENIGTLSGSNYNVTIPSVLSYKNGITITFKASGPSPAGPITVNVNSLGAITIKKQSNVDLAIGDIAAGQVVVITYDGSNFQMTSASGNAGGGSSGWDLTGNTGTASGTNYIGTTDAQDLSIKTNAIERMRIDGTGRVGIGTSSPQFNLHVAGTQAMSLLQTSSASNSSLFAIGKSRGTVVAPSTPLAGDLIGEFVFTAFDGTYFFNEVASINASLSENSTGSASGGFLSLKTTPIGSNVALDRMRITSDGNVGIGNVNPNARLHVTGISGTYDSNLLELEGDYTSFGNYQQLNFARMSDAASVTSIRSVFDNAGQYSLDFYGTTGGSPLSTSIMRMQGNGFVGIGTTSPAYTLDVNGNIHSTGITESSDKRWKKDIVTIDNALAKTLQLRGVNYNWKTEEFKDKKFSTKNQIGLIAQEVETIIPQAVNTDADGFKSVEYSKLVALLIEAIKEQEKKIESLEKENVSIKTNSDNQINLLKAELKTLTNRLDAVDGGEKSTKK